MDGRQLHATERPGDEVKGAQQPEHDTQSEAFLSRTWRKAREDEVLVLRDGGSNPMHQRRVNAPLDEWSRWSRQCCRPALESYRHTLASAKTSRSADRGDR